LLRPLLLLVVVHRAGGSSDNCCADHGTRYRSSYCSSSHHFELLFNTSFRGIKFQLSFSFSENIQHFIHHFEWDPFVH
jgi:hypothetical protein